MGIKLQHKFNTFLWKKQGFSTGYYLIKTRWEKETFLVLPRSNRPPGAAAPPKPSPGGTPQGGLSCPSGNSPPGGPKGSGEECGRKSESQHKRTDLLPGRSSGGGLQISVIVSYRPHSSSVMGPPWGEPMTASPRGKPFGRRLRHATAALLQPVQNSGSPLHWKRKSGSLTV